MLTLALFLTLAQAPLPGTTEMKPMADPAMEMLDGVHAWLDARITSAPQRRSATKPDRAVLREMIGAVDARLPITKLDRDGEHVRWPVLAGVDAEGFVRGPATEPQCYQVLLGDYGLGRNEQCLTLIPTLIDRDTRYSSNARLKKVTNQSHREFIYRMAFEVGRHPIGYEVQKALAAVEWFAQQTPRRPIHVTGIEDGALIALFACALDEQIDHCQTVNLRFDDQRLANNPIDMNLWRFSEHFDKARLKTLIKDLKEETWAIPSRARDAGYDARQQRQFQQLVDHVQKLVREASWTRPAWFTPLSQEQARDKFWRELIGKFPDSMAPVRVETRPRYDEPGFTGYEVKMQVAGPIFAYGHLLIPRGIKAGERRPLVVCQHGLNGRPEDTVLPEKQRVVYDQFSARLANEGFIVYAPQNFYIHEERFRTVQRKANPLGLTLFSFIIAQHQQHLNWLETLPFVDSDRIAFYGLSYGGKTAMRVPPVEPRYKAVICSGDFNEWLWKITSVEEPFSYMFTREYEMLEWNLGHTFNYFEMATLIAPRPFMVERGHDDGVGIDEWVSYEFAKVRRHYAKLGIPERAEIEYFVGPHRIWGRGTFAFLRRHLKFNPSRSTE